MRKAPDILRMCVSSAASARELAGLETFLAEDWTPLRRPERHRRFFAARRAHSDGFDALSSHPPGRTRGALALAGFAPLWLVLEVLVGEKLLLSRRPDELSSAIHAPENSVLELHRSLPRRGRSIPIRAGASCDYAFVRALAWLFVCRRASDRRSAS